MSSHSWLPKFDIQAMSMELSRAFLGLSPISASPYLIRSAPANRQSTMYRLGSGFAVQALGVRSVNQKFPLARIKDRKIHNHCIIHEIAQLNE